MARSNEIAIDQTFRVADHGSAHHSWRNLFEHREPLADDARFVMEHPREIAAWARQADNKACSNWIGHVHKYDWDFAGLPEQCTGNLGRMCEDYLWLKCNQLLGKLRHLSAGRRKANLDAEIATFGPAKFFHFIFKSYQTLLCFGVVFGKAH